jgi:hypothetical protein
MHPELVGLLVRGAIYSVGGWMTHRGYVDASQVQAAADKYTGPLTEMGAGIGAIVLAGAMSYYNKIKNGIIRPKK